MDFEVGGHKYQSTKLDTFKQFHVARKLAPVIGALAPTLKGVQEGDGWSAMLPIAQAIRDLPEADCNYILHACLSVVKRKVGEIGWQNVWNDSAKTLQYQDIQMVEMIQITVFVLQDNIGNFTGALSPQLTVAAE